MALSGSGPRALQDGRGCHPQPRPPTPLHLHTRAWAPECSPSEFLSRSLTQWVQPPRGGGHGQAGLGSRRHAGWGAVRSLWVGQRPDPLPPPARPLLLPHPQS